MAGSTACLKLLTCAGIDGPRGWRYLEGVFICMPRVCAAASSNIRSRANDSALQEGQLRRPGRSKSRSWKGRRGRQEKRKAYRDEAAGWMAEKALTAAQRGLH